MANEKVRIAIIGAGLVSDFHHVPGIRVDTRSELAAVCDPNEQLLNQRKNEWGPAKYTTDYEEIANDKDIDAVIIATPNFTHKDIALACISGGKHVMCEKPLGVSHAEAAEMYQAAKAKGVRHMTAFTYRFALDEVPAIFAEERSAGEPRHFRSQRFPRPARNQLGMAAHKKLAGGRRSLRYDDSPDRFCPDLMGQIQNRSAVPSRRSFRRDKTTDGKSCGAVRGG